MNKKDISDTPICVLPWIHLATHPIGTVTPCCITDMTNGISTAARYNDDNNHLFLSKDSLDDISNSKKFNELRKNMMNGKYSKICDKCYNYERGGVASKRFEYNEKFKKYVDNCFTNTNIDGSLKKIDYKYIELRLGTVCNLKCVSCNPFSSNRWNQDLHIYKNSEFEKDYFKNEIKTEWYRDYRFYDELYDKCENLEEIWINGGEPTLIKEHGYFLERFIESGKCKDIELHYSLNCTQFPDKFLEIWKNFKKVRIQLSIDDLGDRNYYIRFPSDWNVIMQSFNKIIEYKDIFHLEICQTVSCLNIFNINNFKKFAMDNEIIIGHNYVHYPKHLHVSLIPDELKTNILNNLEYLSKEEVDKLKVEISKERSYEEERKFYKFIKLTDLARNVNIIDYLPEWMPYFNNQ
jgi:hypothetical protein